MLVTLGQLTNRRKKEIGNNSDMVLEKDSTITTKSSQEMYAGNLAGPARLSVFQCHRYTQWFYAHHVINVTSKSAVACTEPENLNLLLFTRQIVGIFPLVICDLVDSMDATTFSASASVLKLLENFSVDTDIFFWAPLCGVRKMLLHLSLQK